MNEKIPQEVLDIIVDEINKSLNIPFLNEAQERQLFTLIISLVISAFVKRGSSK